MTTELQVKKICYACGGSGRVDEWIEEVNVGKDCIVCSGTGKLTSEIIDITDLQADITKILRRLKKIMDKLEIGDD